MKDNFLRVFHFTANYDVVYSEKLNVFFNYFKLSVNHKYYIDIEVTINSFINKSKKFVLFLSFVTKYIRFKVYFECSVFI